MRERGTIDPAALDYVGLTPAVLTRFEIEAQGEARQRRTDLIGELSSSGLTRGNDLFQKFTGYPLLNPPMTDEEPHETWVIPIPGQTILLTGKANERYDVPEELFQCWQKAKAEGSIPQDDAELAQATERYVNDVLRGFAQDAIEEEDWQSLVNTYDVITEGGVLNSNDLRIIIAGFPLERNDHDQRTGVAQAITNRLNELEDRADFRKIVIDNR